MVDTVRTLADIIARLPDNQAGNITPQAMRDFAVSVEAGFVHMAAIQLLDDEGDVFGAVSGRVFNEAIAAVTIVGVPGPPGPLGPNGPAGPPGSDGATGVIGNPGTPGVIGPAGALGPTGPTGSTGSAGPTGSGGPPGSTGPNGLNGADRGPVIVVGWGLSPDYAAGLEGNIYLELPSGTPVGPYAPVGLVVISDFGEVPSYSAGLEGNIYLELQA